MAFSDKEDDPYLIVIKSFPNLPLAMFHRVHQYIQESAIMRDFPYLGLFL